MHAPARLAKRRSIGSKRKSGCAGLILTGQMRTVQTSAATQGLRREMNRTVPNRERKKQTKALRQKKM